MEKFKKTSYEVIGTILVFGFIVSSLGAGLTMLGVITLPARMQGYIGGALIGYMLIVGLYITHTFVRANKKG